MLDFPSRALPPAHPCSRLLSSSFSCFPASLGPLHINHSFRLPPLAPTAQQSAEHVARKETEGQALEPRTERRDSSLLPADPFLFFSVARCFLSVCKLFLRPTCGSVYSHLFLFVCLSVRFSACASLTVSLVGVMSHQSGIVGESFYSVFSFLILFHPFYHSLCHRQKNATRKSVREEKEEKE